MNPMKTDLPRGPQSPRGAGWAVQGLRMSQTLRHIGDEMLSALLREQRTCEDRNYNHK